jgi:medium-chain acyl-[acyl-carrier-protein] hydrolase
MLGHAHSQWLVCPQPYASPSLRLFVFPGAGRGPATYRSWSAHLPTGVELCIVHLPGRERRWNEPPFFRFDDLCRTVARALTPALDQPFAFLGHSLGALIAFEVGRRLRSSIRVEPRALFVAAHRAPHIPNRLPKIADVPDAEFVSAIEARQGGQPPVATAQRELVDVMLPTLRADYRVAEEYDYIAAPPLACRISAFGGLDDPGVTEDDLDGWRHHTSSTFRLRMMPGGHFFIDRRAATVLTLLLDDLSA